jgi:Flp pilus assembly protein TadG
MDTENREKGASAVEFALVLPVLMLVLFGIIEFGFILYDKAVITNASREAARKGIAFNVDSNGATVAVPTADIVSTVAGYTGAYLVSLGSTPPAPATTLSGDCSVQGSALTVTVTYPYTFLVLPSFADSLTGGITLSAVTVMNCENQ